MNEVDLNHITTTEWEANIDFGKSKINFLINIYIWRVSLPWEIIYVALADITACFRFPRLCCDITGAFGFRRKIGTSYQQATSLVQTHQQALGNRSGVQSKT